MKMFRRLFKAKKFIAMVAMFAMLVSLMVVPASALTITNNTTQKFVNVQFNSNTCPRAILFTQINGAVVTASGGNFTVSISALNNATITKIEVSPGNPVLSGNFLQLRNLYFSRSTSQVQQSGLANWTINSFNGQPVNQTYRVWFDGFGHQMTTFTAGNYSLPNMNVKIYYQ